MVDAVKVLIFATWQDRLLVFDEPDFPDVPLQVPGGTVESGEDLAFAAAREFFEETGLTPESELKPLFSHDYGFVRDGQRLVHRRHFFHLRLSGLYEESWLHVEETPFGGGDPVQFRLRWIDLAEVDRHFGETMAEALAALARHAVSQELTCEEEEPI